MSKAVMISIKPKWCELIANGKKTIEVRKSRPKIETPFKCYIYCTKFKDIHIDMFLNYDETEKKTYICNGKVIGEFVCDKIDYFSFSDSEWAYSVAPPGSVMPMNEDKAIKIMENKGCLTVDDIVSYFGDEDYKAYFWHISDLKIYDKPKELSEFKRINRDCWYADLGLAKRDCHECKNADCFFKRPPQSWCYVEMEAESNDKLR